jgi:hypothetical protein
MPGTTTTTIRGSEWSPASAWPHQWVICNRNRLGGLCILISVGINVIEQTTQLAARTSACPYRALDLQASPVNHLLQDLHQGCVRVMTASAGTATPTQVSGTAAVIGTATPWVPATSGTAAGMPGGMPMLAAAA